MNGRWRLAAAAAPGLVLALAAFAGWAPVAGDLPTYFVPLRQRTAAVVRGARAPFWNPDSGCGEPFFANPQSALLYPPAWFALLLPARAAVGAEVGFHLALLGLGGAWLARRLGARGWLDVAAGWGIVVAGPVLDAAGVLNNLDALAWAPWVWGAALAGSVAGTAACLALADLAAEPSLALVIGLVALLLAPRRRTLGGIVLAVALVAVQAVPFPAWGRGGARGPAAAAPATAGAVRPAELAKLLAPGAPVSATSAVHLVSHVTLPLWALVLAVVAAFDANAPVHRLAWAGWALALASVWPNLPGGAWVWQALTQGLVRYPGRLLFVAVAALVPAAAAVAGTRRVRPWLAAALGAAVALTGLALRGSVWPTVAGAAASAAVLAACVPAPAAVLGAATLLGSARDALQIQRVHPPRPILCLEAQRAARRLYVVAPSAGQLEYIAGDVRRQRSLAFGYSALADGRHTVRTFAPLASRRLDAQLAEADRGPAGRWWLDALGADRIVSQHPVPGFTELCREGGLTVYDNPEAWPLTAVARSLPLPGQPLRVCGTVRAVATGDDARTWRVAATAAGAFYWLETPDAGWQYRLDGVVVAPVQGVGIVHGVAVPAGTHVVSVRYRPPGFVAGAIISLLGLGVLVGVAWRRW